MYQEVKYINGIFYYEEKDGKYYPTRPIVGVAGGGGGGLSRSQIIKLINQFSGGLAPSYQATATDDITTQSTTDIVATGMTLTPPSGTYLVWFSGSNMVTNDDGVADASNYVSIYSGGVQVSSSEQLSRDGITTGKVVLSTFPFNCVAEVIVNGSQAIEGRWRTSDSFNTGTMHQRNLTILKVAP